jgi:hypothetical protein
MPIICKSLVGYETRMSASQPPRLQSHRVDRSKLSHHHKGLITEVDFFSYASILLRTRRGGRVAEGARLESVYTATYRGFESLSLRQFLELLLKGITIPFLIMLSVIL